MPAQLFKTIKAALITAILAVPAIYFAMNSSDTGQPPCAEPPLSLASITSIANTSVSVCQPDLIFGPFAMPPSHSLDFHEVFDSDSIASTSHIGSNKAFVSARITTPLPSATVSALNVSTTFATPALDFASPSPIIAVSYTPATEDDTEIDWEMLAPLAQRICFLTLFFFLVVHMRRLVKDLRSSTAAATALESLNAGRRAAIARLEGQVKMAASTLAQFPTLFGHLHHAVERSRELETAIKTHVDDDFERNASHLRDMIALYDEKHSLENDIDALQCSRDAQRSSALAMDIAAEEQIASSLAQLSEQEGQLSDLQVEIEGRASSAETLESDIDAARATSHTLVVEKDITRKYLAYLHETDRREAAEADAEDAELEAQLAHIKAMCESTSRATAAVIQASDELAEETDHVLLASHHAQQALIGDLACAAADISALQADLGRQDSEHEQLVAAHDTLIDASAQLDKDAEGFESTLAQLEVAEADLRAASHKDAEEHAVKMAALAAERDALDISQASVLDKLAEVKANADRVDQETAALVSALREQQAADKQHFDEAAAALEVSIRQDDAVILDSQAAIVTQEGNITSTQAALDARKQEFNRCAQDYENDFTETMELKDTIGYDAQQYESMLEDERKLAARACKEQADAEAMAVKARAHSRDVATETAVTKHAFTEQLRDLQEEQSSLEADIAAFKAESARLPAECAQLEHDVADMERTYTVQKRVLDNRERAALDDMVRYKMSAAAALRRLQEQIDVRNAEEVAAKTELEEYQGEVARVQCAAAAVKHELAGTEDELAVERRNASALFDLIQHPSSDPAFVAAWRSPRTPVETPQEPEPEGDDFSAIFDASFEEALEGDIAESKTCKGLAEAGLGLGLIL